MVLPTTQEPPEYQDKYMFHESIRKVSLNCMLRHKHFTRDFLGNKGRRNIINLHPIKFLFSLFAR